MNPADRSQALTAPTLPAFAASAASARADSAESRRIQALRGLACLLLVAFHVIGSRSTSGMHVGADSPYRQFADLLTHIRMPLFTFLSGFVYAYRPVLQGSAWSFAQRKLVRLWLPLVAVSTLYFLLAMVVPGHSATGKMPWGQMWQIYVFPYVHFWFLQAIILIFAAVILLERLRLLSTPLRYLVALAVSAAIHLSIDMAGADHSPFSVVDALYLAPFFLLGMGANRFRSWLLQPAIIWTCAVAFLASMTVHAILVLEQGRITERGTVLGLVIGASSALALVGTFPRLKPLERLGAYSFAIYLFHPFFVAAMRAALKLAGLSSTEVAFALGLGAGVIGPVILECVLAEGRFFRPLNRLLLGKSPRRPGGSSPDAALARI
jgi:peptidoglycan/LPS O-acetylase OafA/YrhL